MTEYADVEGDAPRCTRTDNASRRNVELFLALTHEKLKKRFGDILALLPKENIRIDFSVINDMNYYNGIVFRGFLEGIPSGILSGGQYDNLMKKMGKSSGAIGFAVYPDLLESLSMPQKEYDIDVVLLYGEGSDLSAVRRAVRAITAVGKSVTAQKSLPGKIKYRQLCRLTESGVETVEEHA